MTQPSIHISVIGLGYVGLPLACLFAKRYRVTGYDMNPGRIDALNSGVDATGEIDGDTLRERLDGNLLCTSDERDIAGANVYIITVPTPVDTHHYPDLQPLIHASRCVGRYLKPDDTVIYESTVYPGVTEDVCVPVLEETSGLRLNSDFTAGYSPERINPGDKEHTVARITKVTSGSTPAAADFIDSLYNSVLENGTFKVSSIKVAEASKIIENTQRDVNIAFMNELAKIFNAMEIDTSEVLDAASTKWNFIRMRPGLVGGHCIGVDPYYLLQQSQDYGVLPRLIFEARQTNDRMGYYIAQQVETAMARNSIVVKDSRVLLAGFTFKENCPDIRNTRVADLYAGLHRYTSNIVIYDPMADPVRVRDEYDLEITTGPLSAVGEGFDMIVFCVAHAEMLDADWRRLLRPGGLIYDVTGRLPRSISDYRL